jgi:hypothetical protein
MDLSSDNIAAFEGSRPWGHRWRSSTDFIIFTAAISLFSGKLDTCPVE